MGVLEEEGSSSKMGVGEAEKLAWKKKKRRWWWEGETVCKEGKWHVGMMGACT